MEVKYNGRKFKFRPCDTEAVTQEELQEMVDRIGYMQYEINRSWLVVSGIGYGWEI